MRFCASWNDIWGARVLRPFFRAAGKEKNDSLPKDGIEALVVDMPVAKTVQIQANAGQKTQKQTARPFRPLFCVD